MLEILIEKNNATVLYGMDIVFEIAEKQGDEIEQAYVLEQLDIFLSEKMNEIHEKWFHCDTTSKCKSILVTELIQVNKIKYCLEGFVIPSSCI